MANKKTGGTRLTGLNPLSYLGVEPVSPPQLVRYQAQPTNRDFNFNIGDLWLVEEPGEVWMLLEKPQNVAFWALIYPQGGGGGGISLIHTDAGDVVADVNGEIGIEGGENINTTTSGPNILIINLNRTIQWPNTNDLATEGVIFLGGERFLHNFGQNGSLDSNTFVGSNSGNFALTNSDNTGFGSFALASLTTGNKNTAIGADALANVTSGTDNIAIGSLAGTSVITGSNNILIGNEGDPGDSDDSVIRIGTEGTQVEAHIAGINGITVAGTVTPNTVVNVDDQGQLGQVFLDSSGGTIAITQPSNGVINFEAVGGGGGGGNPFAFSYVQVGDSAAIANGTDYDMGAEVALTKLFDVGNNFNPGDGAGAQAEFTAPVTGKYYFEFLIVISGPGFISGVNYNMSIVTAGAIARTYRQKNLSTFSGIYTLVTDMEMGDTATFHINNPIANAAVTYVVSGNGGVAGTNNINSTRISGFLIPEGASGGNFTQPFLGIQQVDAVNVVGSPITTYFMGSGAIMVEQYDIGGNFNPGDGAGTGCSFTAPATGIYSFSMCVQFSSTTGSMGINTPGLNYYFSTPGSSSIIFETVTVDLTINDIVTFYAKNDNGSGLNTTSILAARNITTGLGNTVNQTFISGYRIA